MTAGDFPKVRGFRGKRPLYYLPHLRHVHTYVSFLPGDLVAGSSYSATRPLNANWAAEYWSLNRESTQAKHAREILLIKREQLATVCLLITAEWLLNYYRRVILINTGPS